MADRVELTGQDLDNVVGGAFHYNTHSDGSMTCRVDGAGTYNCSDSAKNKISLYIVKHKGCSLDDIINYALDNGYFW